MRILVSCVSKRVRESAPGSLADISSGRQSATPFIGVAQRRCADHTCQRPLLMSKVQQDKLSVLALWSCAHAFMSIFHCHSQDLESVVC